ncbi:autotransporter-associated beta strand repeat-containing protein, partial [Escherichia coli]
CQDDPQDCYGLTIGSIDQYQNQAELNVGSTQQTFVHALTGFQNGTLNIDAGGNVTVNQGSFAGTIEGAGQLTIAQNGSYVLAGAQSMALTGDIVVDDGAVLTLEGDAADLAALQDDPQSIVLNGGVLDLSDFATWQSGTSYNDGLAVSGSGGTVIGSQDVVDLAGGDNLHIGGDGLVSLANNNSYLGTTQIASGTLVVSDNSQLGDTHYNRQVIFTDNQQESVMEITANVDTRSTTTEHGRDIEMRADGEVAVDAGVDTQWGGLMADSSGQHQDEGSTLTKTGAGTLEHNDVYLSKVIFDNNQAYTSTSYSDGDGGAIDVTDNNSDITHPSGFTIINNTAFTNNTAEGYGGAIYTNSVSAPYLIDISIDDSYSQNGGVLIDENNSAAGYGDGPSTAAGGFMYLGLSEVTFDIADGKTLVIGNTENDGAVDSIAGTGVITKTGSGDLVLNADNNDFTGEMQIENGEVTLGRSNSLMNVGDTH